MEITQDPTDHCYSFSTTTRVVARMEGKDVVRRNGPTRDISVHYDPLADVLTVNGMRYSGCCFRGFALIVPSDRQFKFVERRDGVVTLWDCTTDREPEV